jgi:mannose-6-phosphate isomerase-like protein (cupin superfamily)
MHGYIGNIEEETKANNNFRKVLFTGPKSQLVVMSLLPGEDIGLEIHEDNDQFLRIEAGKGKVVLGGVEQVIEDDFAVVVPAGIEHNIVNTGESAMKLYTVYSPAHHPEGTIHETKAEAEASED